LPEEEFRTLLEHALSLSLVEQVAAHERADEAWRLHPLLAELLREKPDAAGAPERLTEWFCSRLQTGDEDEQTKSWASVHQESATLTEWLARIEGATLRRVTPMEVDFASQCGPFPTWASAFERAVAHAEDDGERAWFLFQLGHLRLRSGRPDEAMEAAVESGRLAEKSRDEKCAAEAIALRADIFQARGQLDEALRVRKEEELPVYERLGDVLARANTLDRVANILQALGQFDEALRIRKEEVLPVYERLDDVPSILAAKTNLAIMLLRRASGTDRPEAADLLRHAYVLAEKQFPRKAEEIRALMRRFSIEPKES
jgi:tetratricopeptide (TPR) repeat protein